MGLFRGRWHTSYRWLALALAAFTAALSAREPERAKHAMVVSQEPHATDAGLAVLRAGGNAVDAAIAVAFTLAVTYPIAGNIGGGGFMLVRLASGESNFIDFRERAPRAAYREMYLDAQGQVTAHSVVGWRAPGVPGTVAGLALAHRKYGKRPWRSLVTPAIGLARNGFPLSFHEVESLRESAETLEKFPESKRIFLNKGRYFELGDRLRQTELAATLERIAATRGKDFYEGITAKRLAKEMERNGGLITLEDLKAYQPVERQPLKGTYNDYEILTAPPPSAGGVGLVQMLGMLEGSGYDQGGWGAASTYHYLAEVMRRFYADRAQYLGDPDFNQLPVSGLLDPQYVAARRATIDPAKATPSQTILAGKPMRDGSANTTHFSVVDAAGNAVSMTFTLNENYGSSVTVPGLGFLLNDEMDDFTSKPGAANLYGLIQSEANAIAPNKRPLSAMTPTIVVRDAKPYLVIGAPGGPRITTGVMQVILNVVDFRMNAQQAIDAPRVHHQWLPDQLRVEGNISPDTIALLKAMGHEINPIYGVAQVQAILSDGKYLQGAVDGRGGGKAAGY
jgi:gamma-glutamyltranspeptidase/glutathione hydrolase